MALSRRTGARFQASIWPGFVDAMTGLLLVLMFVLTIFMVVQFVLREEISGQADRLDALSGEVAALASALGLEQDRNATLNDRVGVLTATLGDARARQQEQAALIASLRLESEEQTAQLAEAATRITSFEAQVAGLLAQQRTDRDQIAALEDARAALLSEQDQLNLALSGLRSEVDAQEEAARLAAARREALEALVADLRREGDAASARETALTAEIDALETQFSEEQRARLAEAAAAEALRDRLQNADAELTAMTLALEERRQAAEDTLALLAASEAVQDDLNERLAAALVERDEQAAAADAARADSGSVEELRAQLAAALVAKLAAEEDAQDRLSEAEERAALLAQAQTALSEQEDISSAAQREQSLLNQQVAALRTQLGELQALLDDAKEREAASDVQLQSLGNELNTALARVAAEERRRREMEVAEERRQRELEAAEAQRLAETEAAERARLEAEKADLERFRSEFFGRLREVLEEQEGVRIVGDRFVFSSEVLFAPGEASLSGAGREELAKVADILQVVAGDIPDEIDWVIQVDGHTDNIPVVGGFAFVDNWELSQARALSVVRYMIDALGIPPQRLSANGFGEYQPINAADTPEARAQNRRIELKLTER